MSRADTLDRLNAADLRSACADQRIGNRVEVLGEATSTNDVVLKMAAENDEGLVIFAERQTAGRGQYGNHWESAAGKGLWFSILLRPKIPPAEASRLTAWAGETVALTINEQLSLGATVKPPNDVYVAERKVAGILLELRVVANSPNLGILGIGINVNQNLKDFSEELSLKAGSLAMAGGTPVNRQKLAVALLRNLDNSYRVFLS